MKVISIKEPWATLIKDRKKYIETRSWKTNYRGPIYIHASKAKITKEISSNKELMNLVGDSKLNYGYIICQCELIDCVPMTQNFINNLKDKNYQEYVEGIYKEGRYAWILDNIKVLDTPIKVSGQLGIWNYEDTMKQDN